MPHVVLPSLRLVLFFVCFVVEKVKKVFMRHLAISSIVVYYTTIISNTLNKVADEIDCRIVKSWLT